MKFLKQDYDTILENLKAEAMQDAIKFIQKHEVEIKGALTRDYDNLVKQFFEYRDNTDKKIHEMQQQRTIQAELN